MSNSGDSSASRSDSPVLLEVRDLEVSFRSVGDGGGRSHQNQVSDVQVIKKVSFSIARGEVFALVGESGSGKSMTAFSIMRLLPGLSGRIHGGSISFEGTDLLALSERQMREVRGHGISMIFQEPMTCLNPVMTIGDQVLEVLELHLGVSRADGLERVVDLLQSVGISDAKARLDWYPHQLSGGQKQRILIAMALACGPKLLIADEPTTALDVTVQAQILTLLKGLQSKYKLSMLFITHDLAVVSQMADRVGVMLGGEIIEQGSVDDFFRCPKTEYGKELLNSVPRLEFEPREQVAASEELLSVSNLSVRFPIRKGFLKRIVGHVEAVKEVSLSLSKASTLAVVGESGSGKTTLGKALLRLVDSEAERVSFSGNDIFRWSKSELRLRRRMMQIIFQDPFSSMNPRMRVGEIILEGMRSLRVGADDDRRNEKIEQLLQRVGLSAEHRFRYPHEFSGGQRQRICIARVLAVEPQLIVCDEPTSALDVSVRAQVLGLLKELQQDLGVSYLFITHDLSLVPHIADEIAVMKEGKIVEFGSVEAVLGNPQHPYTKVLLSSVPRLAR